MGRVEHGLNSTAARTMILSFILIDRGGGMADRQTTALKIWGGSGALQETSRRHISRLKSDESELACLVTAFRASLQPPSLRSIDADTQM